MGFEVDFLLFLQGLRESLPDMITSFLAAVSWLAASPVPIVAVAIIIWCVDKKAGFLIGFNYTAANVVVQFVKCIACINRPWIIDSRIEPEAAALDGATGYSFPSGHSALAVSVYGSIAYVFRRHKPLVIFLIALAVLSVFSRVWLGVHMPKDVFAGALIAMVVLLGSIKLARYVNAHPEKDLPLAIAGIIIGIAMALVATFKGYPLQYLADGSLLVDPYDMQTDCFRGLGAWLGFCVAWIVDRRFINFTTDGTRAMRVLRGVIGAIVVGAFYIVILPLVFDPLGDHWGKLLKYFCTLVIVGNLYPLCFMKVRKRLAKRTN